VLVLFMLINIALKGESRGKWRRWAYPANMTSVNTGFLLVRWARVRARHVLVLIRCVETVMYSCSRGTFIHF